MLTEKRCAATASSVLKGTPATTGTATALMGEGFAGATAALSSGRGFTRRRAARALTPLLVLATEGGLLREANCCSLDTDADAAI